MANAFEIKRKPIYTHTHLNVSEAENLAPLMESVFADEFKRYDDPKRANGAQLKAERLKMVSEQFANRCRVARNMGVSPLNEDANIFRGVAPDMVKMFESVSMPSNIVGMGNVTNPMEGNRVAGGMWNPAYKPGSGDVPSYIFGLQTHLALHCIGFDMLPTISVDTPKIVLTYIDTIYGGGSFDDTESLPSYIELSADLFKYSWVKAKALKRAVTELVLVSSKGKALKVRFIVRSMVAPALTVEVLSTGDYASNAYTETNKYSVKTVIDEINAEAGAKVYVLPANAGEELGYVTLNYASAIRTNIAEAASNNNSLGGMNRAQMEKGPKHKLNVVAMDKQLEVVGIEIEADTSNIQIKDMAAMGVNVIAHLYTGVQNQLVQTLEETILDHLYKLGVQHAVNAYLSQGVDYSLYIDAPAKTEIGYDEILDENQWLDMLGNDVRSKMGEIKNAIVSSAYENQMTHADRLYGRVLKVVEFVGQQNRIACPDFIVLCGELAATLKKNAKFSPCPHTQTLSTSPEIVYSGTIYDTISVYKNPRYAFNDPRILVGRHGDDTDPGAKFIAYDLAASRQIVAEQTMAEKIRVWSRFAIADIGFYPELNYFTFVAKNGFEWI